MKQETADIQTIIELAPPFFRLPVQGYGGSERVVWSLAKEFAKRPEKDPSGPKLELWATADCERTADGVIINLVPTVAKAHGYDKFFESTNDGHTAMYKLLDRLANDPKAVGHVHSEDTGFMVMSGGGIKDAALRQDVATRTLTTIHNLPKDWAAEHHGEMPVVAISHAQAKKVRGFDFVRVVHNGIDADLYKPIYYVEPDAPFCFLGRLSPKKNPIDAINIAVACGSRIRVAGPPDVNENEYQEKVERAAAIHHRFVEMIPEVSDMFDAKLGMSSKNHLLANSRALLFPIQWEEPYGLVVAEANACGTPVIAFNHPGSSVDELIVNGVNGYKVSTLEEAIDVAKYIDRIDRKEVRAHFLRNMTSGVMAEEYMKVITQDLPDYRASLGIRSNPQGILKLDQ